MSLAAPADLALAFRFDVEVDGNKLGSWTTCKGLSVRFKHQMVKELGQHEYISYIPGYAEFPKVTLQRAMQKDDWAKTRSWLNDVARASWMTGEVSLADSGASGGTGAKVTLRDGHGEEVASWTLSNAMPIGWKGPALDANSKKVALETLELVHEGFLDG